MCVSERRRPWRENLGGGASMAPVIYGQKSVMTMPQTIQIRFLNWVMVHDIRNIHDWYSLGISFIQPVLLSFSWTAYTFLLLSPTVPFFIFFLFFYFFLLRPEPISRVCALVPGESVRIRTTDDAFECFPFLPFPMSYPPFDTAT